MISCYQKILLAVFICFTNISFTQDLTFNSGADVVSHYIWRGINVNDALNVQPALTLSVSGFSLGLWGSYSIFSNSTENAFGQELDTWIGYTYVIENGMSISAVVTDYYFANAGIKWGNFNNYNDPNGPGAHTIEAGIQLKGPQSFPLSIAGYINFYNDAGNNTYFQIDYSTTVAEVPINFFIGGSGGSKENPDYYGTEKFNVTNIGIKVTKSVNITEEYALPISTTFLINPRTEISYLVFGITF